MQGRSPVLVFPYVLYVGKFWAEVTVFPGSCENVDVEGQLQENILLFLWPRERVSNSVSQSQSKDSHTRWSLIAGFRDSAGRNAGCTLYLWGCCPGNFCKSGERIPWCWLLNGMLDVLHFYFWSYYVPYLLMRFDWALQRVAEKGIFILSRTAELHKPLQETIHH